MGIISRKFGFLTLIIEVKAWDHLIFLADPGKDIGCSVNTVVVDSISH